MYTSKEKGQRNFVPVTPDFHPKARRESWFSIGSAIILISVIVAILLGFWAITF
jgi:hypothetical protein